MSLSNEESGDFDLSVSGGSGAGAGCQSDAEGQYDTCEVMNPSAGTWTATCRRSPARVPTRSISTTFGSASGPNPGGACTPGDTTLCLPGADSSTQFEVTLDLNDARAPRSQGRALSLSSLGVGQGGLFWIFGADNPEVLVKVLNACAISPSYWVFFSAGTDLGFELVVRDTVGGTTRRYNNAPGNLAAPVADVMAIPCP